PVIPISDMLYAPHTAPVASTRPAPVASSSPGVAGSPAIGCKSGTGLHMPATISRAEPNSAAFMSPGVAEGTTCLTNAATPASCGAAADVPLNAAQPSFGAV